MMMIMHKNILNSCDVLIIFAGMSIKEKNERKDKKKKKIRQFYALAGRTSYPARTTKVPLLLHIGLTISYQKL